MKITKFGHSCLLLEEEGTRLLVDPGNFSAGFERLVGIDAIIFTHEHADHADLERLPALILANPNVSVYTNAEFAKKLDDQGIGATGLVSGEVKKVGSISIRAEVIPHAIMYPNWPQCDNLTFWVNERFYHPGDTLVPPKERVTTLALPVAGPWLKLADAIDFAKMVTPQRVIVIHDGILKNPGSAHLIPRHFLEPLGMSVITLKNGESFQV